VTPGLRASVAGCLLSGSLVLIAGGRAWARVTYPPGVRDATGTELVGSVAPWGLVALAGVVAIAATRRWGRVPVGVALAASGVAVAAIAVNGVRDLPGRIVEIRRIGGTQVQAGWAVHPTFWPYVLAGAGLLLAATGAVVTVRGPRWAALGARYDVPADRPRTDADVWAAQDRGEDPTA
jgi:hypothetical protein